MRFALALIGLLAAVTTVQASTAPNFTPLPPSAAQAETTQEKIRRGAALLDANEPSAAAAAFNSAIQSPDFATIPEDQRYLTLLAAGQIAEQAGEHKAAYPLLFRASEYNKAESSAWHARLAAAFSLKDFLDSARCIATIARRWPDTLDQINDRAIYRIEAYLGVGTEQVRVERDMLESLFDAKWKDSDGEPSTLWRDLARLLLDQGKIRKADAVAERIQSARVALSMRVDKRFDPITRRSIANYDIDRLVARELEEARVKALATPNMLRPQVLLQALLLDNLQYEQALSLGDDIIAKSKDGAGASLYTDFDDQYIWILDQRERALARLGRWDEAVRQLEQAARHPEQGVMNVSQIINLGTLYACLGKATEALDTVSDLGPPSPYGRMQQEMVGLIVATQKNDKAAIAVHLQFMREHRADAVSTWEDALLLSGELDAAADLLIERLKNTTWRSDALSDVQNYADVTDTPVDSEQLKRLRSIVSQPKVQNELAKVGRIEHVNLDPKQN